LCKSGLLPYNVIMKTTAVNCLNCDKPFEAQVREVNRGNGKYCTRKCSSQHRASLIPKPKANCSCAQCGAVFYRNKTKRRNSKSGLFFCNRECKEKAQRFDGIKAIHPTHYGTGHSVYRKTAFRSKPKACERCGYDRYLKVLQVHHIDRNRSNGALENLEILCPNCHEEEHLLQGDGRFVKQRRIE